jgi:hypothetical protein
MKLEWTTSFAPKMLLFNVTWKTQKGNNIKMSRGDRIMGVGEGRVGVSFVERSVSSSTGWLH